MTPLGANWSFLEAFGNTDTGGKLAGYFNVPSFIPRLHWKLLILRRYPAKSRIFERDARK